MRKEIRMEECAGLHTRGHTHTHTHDVRGTTHLETHRENLTDWETK